MHSIDLGTPALLAFSGPDAVRFLNGQLTQDVRQVASGNRALPACITDAKGKLQFRVWLHARGERLMVEGPAGMAEAIEARLTRYLIADEVEVDDASGYWKLVHLTGTPDTTPAGVIACPSKRFGGEGCDWWIPAGIDVELPPALAGDELETLRIARGIPAWGSELTEGMLPPEAGLDATDISYHKGCYIGQEVISRIKSAGKLNRRLARLSWDAAIPTAGLQLVAADGSPAGTLTSIAPLADGNTRHALGFLSRGVENAWVESAAAGKHPVALAVS